MTEFQVALIAEAEKAKAEYDELVRQRPILEVKQYRTKQYIDQLNAFLVEYGEKPVEILGESHD